MFYAWGGVMSPSTQIADPVVVTDTDAGELSPAAVPAPTARQYVHALVWAAVLGALTAGLSSPHVDAALLPVLAVTGAGVGFVASLDVDTGHILNRHIAVIAALTVAGLAFAQAMGHGVALRAVLAAVGAFIYMFILALPRFGMGGGDVKYAPVPAAGLASVGLLVPLLWLWFVFAAAVVGLVALRARSRLDDGSVPGDDTGGEAASSTTVSMPMGPCMAVAVVLAIPTFAWFSELLPSGGF